MRRLVALGLVLLIVLCWWQVLAAQMGLTVREFDRAGVPLTFMARQGIRGAPGVIIAHGFAGSRQLMYGYGYVLAHAGYAVLLLDFGGHGANRQPLNRLGLQRDIDTAYAALLEQAEVDGQRVALLGHSMGSGAIMAAATRQPDRYSAVVAISPTSAEVTSTAPRNLMLQAGAWEPGFVANAQRLLAEAGGENDAMAQGQGRRFVLIPYAEHISILFRDASHQAALAWLNAASGLTTTATYVDRRIVWYGVHLLAWLALGLAIGGSGAYGRGAGDDEAVNWRDRVQPLTPRRRAIRKTPALDQHTTVEERRSLPRPPRPAWVGLLLAPIVAGGAMWLLSLVVDLASLGGLQVGGAVAVWFALAGLVWLALMWSRLSSLSGQIGKSAIDDVRLGLALFALLWVAFGLLAHQVWLPWLLIPARLIRWPLLALACLPWFVAAGVALAAPPSGSPFQGRRWGETGRAWGQAVQWLAQSGMLMVGFLVTLWLVPSLGFIVLLLPLFPILTGLVIVAGARLNRPWAFGLGSALFFGWVIAAAFPLTG